MKRGISTLYNSHSQSKARPENAGQKLLALCENGDLNAMQRLPMHEVSPDDIGDALWTAATYGYLPIVNYLLTIASTQISPHFKGMALIDATRNGHLNIVQHLLNMVGNEISDFNKDFALQYAIKQHSRPGNT